MQSQRTGRILVSLIGLFSVGAAPLMAQTPPLDPLQRFTLTPVLARMHEKEIALTPEQKSFIQEQVKTMNAAYCVIR